MQRSRLELIVILGALTAFGPLSVDMYLPALPTLERVFDTTPGRVQFTLAAFFAGTALGQIVYGPISDRFGRRAPLYVSLTLFAIASAGCAWAASIEGLAAWRFVQAIGACAGGVIARAVVRDLFDPRESVRIYAGLMLVMGVVPILAPIAGGYVLVWLGWPAIFLLMAVAALLCLVAVHLRLPETRNPAVVRPLAFGSIVTVYRRLLGHRYYLGCALTGSASISGVFAYIAGAPHVFIEIHGVAPEHFGWLFGVNAAGFVAAAQVNGRMLRGFDPAQVLRAGSAVQALAALVLLGMAKFGGAVGLLGIAAPLFVFIAGMGFVLPNAAALAMAPHGENAGAASALMGMLQFTAGALATLGVGAVPDASAVPMAAVMAVCGILAFGFFRVLAGGRAGA
jgi:DHA1 family bicyclomycin/chloramphenicol resistance-like MFS transporter